jgi:hypothetical protein
MENRVWSEHTEQFLSHFTGLQIFVSMPEYKDGGKPFHYQREYSDIGKELATANVDGPAARAIFFTVNELDQSKDDGRHRTGKMIKRFRAVFLDDDNPRDDVRDDFPLVPSLIVNSSPGKYHYYWLIEREGDSGLQSPTVDQWKSVQLGLVNKYDGDKNARDVPRYLRLPGYHHLKHERYMVKWTGDGRLYKWSEIQESMPSVATNPAGDSTTAKEQARAQILLSGKSKGDSIAEIMSGKNYHENLVSLSYQMKQEGVRDDYIVLALQGFMQATTADKDERWQSRYDDIPRIVAGAVEKTIDLGMFNSIGDMGDTNEGQSQRGLDTPLCESSDSDSSDSSDRWEMPWPNGMLGELARDAYDMARFQYREVAIVSAIGLVAGIVGRKFNVSNTGLNLYLTLIMQSGMGKDAISEFVHRTLYGLNEHGNASSFAGPVRFTGPKGVIKSLDTARSQVCVFTEAGLLLKSKSGDKEGLARVLLSLYGRSGWGQYSGSEIFSKDEDMIKSLHAPALTIINEATPETLLEAFDSDIYLERGDLPRQSIYRVHGRKPYPNINTRLELSPDSLDKLKHLTAMCSKIQSVEDFKVHSMQFHPSILNEVNEYAHYLVDIENEQRGSNPLKSLMASRMWLKAAKFSAIAAVYNNDHVTIHQDDWKWGLSMVEYEMGGIESFFSGSKKHSEEEVEIAVVCGKILNNRYKSAKMQSSTQDRKRGIVSRYAIRQAAQNLMVFKTAQQTLGRHRIDYIIDRMIDDGFFDFVDKGRVRITNQMSILLKEVRSYADGRTTYVGKKVVLGEKMTDIELIGKKYR